MPEQPEGTETAHADYAWMDPINDQREDGVADPDYRGVDPATSRPSGYANVLDHAADDSPRDEPVKVELRQCAQRMSVTTYRIESSLSVRIAPRRATRHTLVIMPESLVAVPHFVRIADTQAEAEHGLPVRAFSDQSDNPSGIEIKTVSEVWAWASSPTTVTVMETYD